MDFKVEDPPLKMTKKKKKKKNPLSPSLSSLPNEIIENCLARISKSQYGSLCLVSKSFHSLLSSPDIYAVRSQLGATEPRLYVCMWSPNHPSWFTLGETNKGELSLIPLKLSSSYSPTRLTASATIVAVGSTIYQIGGAINEKRSNSVAKRSKAVHVFDCQSNTWRRGPNMTVGRRYAKSCFLDGKIYVLGGCSKIDEEPMNCGEIFDLKTQTWKPLPRPSNYIFDTNDKLGDIGGRLYVITINNNNKYAYDPEQGRWVVPDVGFVGLEPISSINGPWCVIENVMFGNHGGKVKWYKPRCGKWYPVHLHQQLTNRFKHGTFQLVNHGGKLVIIWYEWIRDGSENKRIWCAVIRLEKHVKYHLHGEVERCDVVHTGLGSHKLPSCLSILV